MSDTTPSHPAPRRRRGTTRAPLLAEPPVNERALAEERARLDADIEELRESEANLRAYEKRLRALQAELDGMSRSQRATLAPFRGRASARTVTGGDTETLKAEWDKLIRARELLQLEQDHLRGDRLALSDEAAVVRRRAQAVTERETRLAEREAALLEREAKLATMPPPPPADIEPTKPQHLLSKVTMAPFAMGRSLLRRSKD